MQKICDGWGVYLESVEITEVLISSGSVFKDLQADYREKMRYEAEGVKMTIATELKQFREVQEIAMTKLEGDHYAEIQELDQVLNQTLSDIREKAAKEQAVIMEERTNAATDLSVFKDSASNENNQQK